MRGRRHGVALLAGLLLLAACGGDGADEPTLADQKLAEALLLRLADLPEGFEEQPDEGGADEVEDPFDRCLGAGADKLGENTAEAESPDFETDLTFAISSAAAFATEDDAAGAFEVLRTDALKECFREAIGDAVREEAAADGESVPGLAVEVTDGSFPVVGDEVVAYRALITFAIDGRAVQFPFDLVFVRARRGIGLYAFGGFGAPFPAADAEAAVDGAVGRAA